jgi:3,4-dihydroxy 2-butanone 4-phosphate synthase/GTP cyclohydrolase II
MKLNDWLKRNTISRADFARRTGLSKGASSQICNQEAVWVSRDTARLILRETGGAATTFQTNAVAGGTYAPFAGGD